MATLGQIFGQQKQGFQQFVEPEKKEPTPTYFVSSGSLSKQMTPATPVQQAPTQTPFVTRQPSPVQTPVAPNVPTPTPTIGQTYQNFVAPSISKEQEAEEKALGLQTREAKKLANSTVNQSEIFDNVMSRYQAEIDAINQIYAQTASEARQQGLGTLGSTRAIQARSGLLGSDFASSQNANVESQNADILRTIDAEKEQKISNLYSVGRAEAVQEFADKRKAIQEGLQSYIAYLGAQTERRQSKLAGLAQALIDQGVRPDELDPKQIEELAKSYGVNPQEISSAYTSRERELLASQQGDGFTLSEGQERYEYNPTTGQYQLVAAGAPKMGGGTDTTLNAAQKTKLDSINNVKQQLANYRTLIENSVGATGGNQFGADAAQLRTAKAALEFAIANAVGTGALQAADRAVVEEIIPDPTTFFGAPDRWAKGGKSGVLASVDEASKIFDTASQSIGSQGGSQTSTGDSVFAERWDN